MSELICHSRFMSLPQRTGRYTCPYCRKEVFPPEDECGTRQEAYSHVSVYTRLPFVIPGITDILRLAKEAIGRRHAKQRAEQEVVGRAVRRGFYRSTCVRTMATRCLPMDLGLDQLRALKKAIKPPPSMQPCTSAQIIRVLLQQSQSRSR